MAAQLAKLLSAFLGSVLLAPSAYSCTISAPVSNTGMVKAADAIVRAIAVEYETPPADRTRTTGVPDSKIRFKIVENLRGRASSELVLPGYLVDRDDFNDHEPPYRFVRPGGRAGSCFANSYRTGRQFLLFLKKTESGELTVNWYALGPVNEQLRSEDDPWLLWVRERAQGGR